MNLILAWDTETTGLPIWDKPSDDPRQPHLVDIAALLYNDAGELVDSFEAIVKPDGWTIPKEVSDIHGITQEMAMDVGIPERDALEGFLAIHARAGLRVAHNASFDDRIIRIAVKRYKGEEPANLFREGPKFCTALRSKPVLKLPPTEAMKRSRFRNEFKTPNLAEAYKHFTGEEFAGAHRAKADATACARVYFELKKLEA